MAIGIEAARISVVATADTTAAEAGLKKLDQATKKAGDSAMTAAQKIASGLSEKAVQLESDLRKSAAAANALALQLGPELAAKVNPERLVAQFREMGAEFEDIQANAEHLAKAVGRVADIENNVPGAARQFGVLADQVHRTGTEADRSRSVMANFVGNAAQEIPGLSGAFGPLNVAIGQFAEYATEGGIAIGGLLKTMAPIAALTFAIPLAGKLFSAFGDSQSEVEKRTKALADALAGTVVQVVKSGDSAGKAAVGYIALGNAIGDAGEDGDVTAEAFTTLGVASDQTGKWLSDLNTNAAGAKDGLYNLAVGAVERLPKGLRLVGQGLQDFKNDLASGKKDFSGYNDAVERVAKAYLKVQEAAQFDNSDVLRPSILESAAAFGDAGEQALRLAEAETGLNRNGDHLLPLYLALTEKLNGLSAGTQLYATSAEEAAQWIGVTGQAVEVTTSKVVTANAPIDTMGVLFGEVATNAGLATEAYLTFAEITGQISGENELIAVNNSMDRVTQATKDYQKAVKEGSPDVDAKYRAMRSAINEARLGVIGLHDETLKLPHETKVAFQALIDMGSVAVVQNIINRLSDKNTIWFETRTRNGGGLVQKVDGEGATGGIVTRPTVALIGEAGPEAVVPLNRTPGSSPLPSGGGGGVHIGQVTLVAQPGTNGVELGRQFIEYIAEAEKVYGTNWRAA